jgi:DNA helicase-2/ATP-dependent DNA helicase PcrA
VRFFEQAHIKDFVAQLRLITNPTDSSAMDRLFGLLPRVGPATVNKIGKAAKKDLEKMLKEHTSSAESLFEVNSKKEPTIFDALSSESIVKKVPADAQEDYQSLTASLIESYNLLQSSNGESTASDKTIKPTQVVEKALDGWYGDYIRNVYPDWQDRRDDLNSLVEFAARFETMTELLAQLVLLSSETSSKSVDPDESSIRMTTIHQAKGLEFPIVFLISASDEMLPLKRAIEEGDVEEERRLFYVAVTRAMNELYISVPLMQSNRGSVQRLSPSRFLSEINPATFEKIQYRAPDSYY